MLFLRFALFVGFVIVMFLMVTEIAIPLYQGRPLFPMFRGKKKQELIKELFEVEQQHDELDVVAEITARRRALEKRVAEYEAQNQPEVASPVVQEQVVLDQPAVENVQTEQKEDK